MKNRTRTNTKNPKPNSKLERKATKPTQTSKPNQHNSKTKMSASDSTTFVATTFVAGSTTFIVSAESAASATTLYVAPPTMAELMKEAFENMPDTLDTKKEIEEYFKNAMKDIVKAKKEAEPKKPKTKKTKDTDTDEATEDEEKPKQPKKRKTKKDADTDETDETDAVAEEKPKQPKKRKTKKDADTDETDEEPKQPKQPKRPLTKYQEFFKENYHKIDKAIPNKERCSKVAELWKIHKAELAEKAMDE